MTSPKDGPIYDDFGNLVHVPGGAFVNERGNIEIRKAPLPERIVERNAGCWNCLHFDTGFTFENLLIQHYTNKFKSFKERGFPDEPARQHTEAALKPLQNKGHVGVCLKGKSEGDFVANRYLCDNGWSGVQGASLARAPGEALSATIAEVKDKLGDPK
jgi:hypothetical protein